MSRSIPKPSNFVAAPLMALSLAIHLPWNLATAQSSGAAAAGLLIYKDVPHGRDELASVMEFSSAERVGRVTAVTPVGKGKDGTIRILPELVTVTLHYVDFTSGTFASEDQIAELRATPPRLGEIAKKHPKAYNLLAAEGQRIQVALQMLDQGKILVKGNWQDKAEMTRQAEAAAAVTLTITGEDGQKRTLSSVRVTGVDPDALRVMHSGGVASIPIEALDEADRLKHGLDMAKAEAYRKEKAEAASNLAASTPAMEGGEKGASPSDSPQPKLDSGEEVGVPECKVIQTTEDGLLLYATRIDAKPGFYSVMAQPHVAIFLTGYPEDVVDGEFTKYCVATRDGTLQYESVEGAMKTVRKYKFVRMGME